MDPKFRLHASPDLKAITPGAVIRYSCVPKHAETIGPRSKFKWLMYPDRATEKRYGDEKIVSGPAKDYWDLKWNKKEGRYNVVCCVKSYPDWKQHFFIFQQRVDKTETIVGSMLANSFMVGPANPWTGLLQLKKYYTLLYKASKQIKDKELKKRHDKQLKELGHLWIKTKERLTSTDKKERFPFLAVHLDVATQQKRRLNVFLSRVKKSQGEEEWVLVDWTDPTSRVFSGEHKGTGKNAREAIEDALSTWDPHNRYPKGRLRYLISPAACGVSIDGGFETDGATRWDSVSNALAWVATGAVLVVTLLAPIPGSRIASAALWTSIYSSTAAAMINIGQRHKEGFGSWKDDAFDGLTIIGNVFMGAGTIARTATRGWQQCATINLTDRARKVVKYALIGEVATDGVQGVLIHVDHIHKYHKLMEDKTLTPKERADRLLELFRSLALSSLMTYVSVRGTKLDLKNLSRKAGLDKPPGHKDAFEGFTLEERKAAKEKLRRLKDPKAEVEIKPPPVEGHTKNKKQKTWTQTDQQEFIRDMGEIPSFEQKFPKDKTIWRDHIIKKDLIYLRKYDGHKFIAECNEKGELYIDILTYQKGKERPKELFAKELYPMMFKHFAEQGRPVTAIYGWLIKSNWAAIKKARRGPPKISWKKAVLHAKTASLWVDHNGVKFDNVTKATSFVIKGIRFRVEQGSKKTQRTAKSLSEGK